MESIDKYMNIFKEQLKEGDIQKAYKILMEYIMNLRTHFMNEIPDFPVSGSIYHGYMDMTYFAIFPDTLKNRKLKIAVVFVYNTFRFEVWLSGANKNVQSKYWKLFTENKWEKYAVVPSIQGYDSIMEHILVANPDFSDMDVLTEQIVRETKQFIRDVECFLVDCQ